MCASVSVDIIAPKNASRIRVCNGKTMAEPSGDNSAVTKAYVDSLAASGSFSSGNFSLEWYGSGLMEVYYVKPNPYNVVLTLSLHLFIGDGSVLSAANVFPDTILPKSGTASTSNAYNTFVPVTVTSLNGSIIYCEMAIPRSADHPILLYPGHSNALGFQEGAELYIAQTCVVYSLFEP